MTDLSDLIERLEKAEGPSEELDAEIRFFVLSYKNDFRHLAYTASLDAALTLAPEGWRCTHAYWATDKSDPGATFNLTLPQSLTGQPSCYATGSHKHSAIALDIAALKARQVKP